MIEPASIQLMTLPIPGPSDLNKDDEIEIIKAALYTIDPDGQRMADVIRATYDQLLDGRRTGRWDYADLHKTEKTHMGTLVEINIYKDFHLMEGNVADYVIQGIEVDCKYAKGIGGWEIGPQLVGYVCLVITASDLNGTWQAGLVRASEEHLRSAPNRDMKRKLNAAGITSIDWLWGGKGELDTNQLLHMDPSRRARIMSARNMRNMASGQARINRLFTEIQQTIIRRVTVETVGHGLEDPLKRVRDSGGARSALRGKGILILGHQDYDPLIAKSLGLSVPQKGQFISVRVVPVPNPRGERPAVEIEGQYWSIASGDDSSDPLVAAPVIPKKKKSDSKGG